MQVDKQRDGTEWALPSDEELVANPGNWSLALRMGTVAARVEQAMKLAETLGITVYFHAQDVHPGDLHFMGSFPFMPDKPAVTKDKK